LNSVDKIEVPPVVDEICQVACLEGVVCFYVVTLLFNNTKSDVTNLGPIHPTVTTMAQTFDCLVLVGFDEPRI
jgi:hypothetical protein